jgi:hypothetical protein
MNFCQVYGSPIDFKCMALLDLHLDHLESEAYRLRTKRTGTPFAFRIVPMAPGGKDHLPSTILGRGQFR